MRRLALTLFSGSYIQRAACALLAFGLIVTASYQAVANDSRSMRFRHISRDDGLSQSFIYAIVQDRTGFMWFGTQEGLNRYDGFEFTVFAHDPQDTKSISDESIRTIFEDRSGTLWIGTDAGGLSKYDPTHQSFTNYLHDPANASSIASNAVRVVYEDNAGTLWIGTDGAGLDRFDRDSKTFEHFPHDVSTPGSLSGAHVWDILQTSDGTLFVATDKGLSRFDSNSGTFTNFTHDPKDVTSLSDNRLRALFEDDENTLWIGTEAGGLNRFDEATTTFERFLHDPDDASSISADRINAIYQDNIGVLWIGTDNGLNAWDPMTSSFDHYIHNPNDRYTLAHDTVMSIFQDRGSVFWVGTYNGLSVWNPTSRAMLHYKHDAVDPLSLGADTVTSFAENSDGTIWVGTYGGGLSLLSRETGTFEQIRHQPNDPNSLSSDRVMAVHVDSDGNLWVGTRAAGLNRYDRARNSFVRYQNDPDDPTSLSADGVTYVLEDSKGGLWVATFGGGLNYMTPNTGEFKHYRNEPDDPTTLSSDRVLVLFEDQQQNLWIGTYGGGLNRFDPVTNTFTHYRADPNRADSLSGDEIYMIQEDGRGDLWIGVKGRGLNRWRHADRELGNPTFEAFTEIDGLPSTTVYSGMFDQLGHLWMSTSYGLSKLDVESLEFKNYNNSHGLQGEEFNLAAGYRASDGQLFFGGLNGFNSFDPGQLVANSSPPQVVITRFLSLNDPVSLGDAVDDNNRVQLGREQYSIGFEFAALDFAAPENNRYMYQLEGFDDDWVDAGTKRQATYTNLPAGNYTFKVRASNNDGVWSAQDAELDIRMNPAFWRTWWAYLLYLVILTAILYAAYRAHAKRTVQAAKLKYADDIRLIQASLSEAQRIASIGNWEWDTTTDKLWWSDETHRLFETDPQTFEVTRDFFLKHVHPDDRDAVREATEHALFDRQPYSINHRIIGANGTERFVHSRADVVFDAHGRPARLSGTVHDITERQKAERDIRHRANYQALLASLSSGLIRARPDDISRPIRDGIEMVGTRYELDAIGIWWLSDDQKVMQPMYRWNRVESGRAQETLVLDDIPWAAEKLLAGQSIVADDVAHLPSLASEDQKYFQKRGNKSFLMIPLMVDENLEGTCVFSTLREVRNWPTETISELKLVAENMASAISRSKSVAEIEELKGQLQDENLYLREEIRLAHSFSEIIGEDPQLRRCLRAVEKVAPTDVAVLILGETGTGKELIARAVHNLSNRRDKPMVSVNCPALPAEIIESELFGHEKGAFTGALSQRRGRFELANGGTLFLDEIGELPLELQSKLLRVLQTGNFERLGGTKTLFSDVRIIAATNRDLHHAQEQGAFRSDLYYRISSFPIHLPTLRDRSGDIPLLAEYFVHKHAERLGKEVNAISAKMIRELMAYSWPGNIRELESTIERALISSDNNSVLELPRSLPWMTKSFEMPGASSSDDHAGLYTVERSHIISVLDKTNWKISGKGGAAFVLGIPPSTLRSKMKRLKITRQAT